jgi:hypothetical protein
MEGNIVVMDWPGLRALGQAGPGRTKKFLRRGLSAWPDCQRGQSRAPRPGALAEERGREVEVG